MIYKGANSYRIISGNNNLFDIPIHCHVRGTSNNTSGTEIFNIQYISEDAVNPDTATTVTVSVNSSGNWSFSYFGKKIYSLTNFAKNNTHITSIDLTECDLSYLISATDCFDGCTSLTDIALPDDSWQPDLDLSDTAVPYSNMSGIIDGLYVYSSGVHSVTFNSTIWDALTSAQQQTIFDAAQLKNWTTNAVQITYYVRGTSSNVNGQETFKIQYINDGAANPSTAETFNVNVDGNGRWEFSYRKKKIYSLAGFSNSAPSSLPENTTLLTVDFSDAEGDECVSCGASWNGAFGKCTALTSVDLSGCTFAKCTSMMDMFYKTTSLQTVIWSQNLNLDNLQGVGTSYHGMFELSGISGAFDAWQNQTLPNLTSIIKWFTGSNITSIKLPLVKFDKVTNRYYCSQPFANISYLQSIDISSATFENLEDLGGFASSCPELTTIIWDEDKLNFSKVENSTISGVNRGMFQGCTKLTSSSILALRKQTFPKLKTIGGMFYNCAALTTVDLSAAIFGDVTNSSQVFQGCTNLTSVNLSSATFASATTMLSMFNGCSSLQTITFKTGITLSNVTTIQGVFQGCTNLTSVNLSSATFASATNMQSAFQGCSSLTAIDLSSAILASTTTASDAFRNCTSVLTINLSSATFASLTNSGQMFYDCSSATSINLSSATFDVLGNCQGMFRNCAALQTITFKPGITLSNVTTAQGMFLNCAALQTADLSSATFASCTKTGDTNIGMFHGCGLSTIDLSSAIFGEVGNASFMFYGCKASSILLPRATFAKVTTCFRMFENCDYISSISLPEATFALSGSSQVMFEGCNILTQVSLPKATFASVTNASQMFSSDTLLQTILMPLATFERVGGFTQAFYNCAALTTLDVPQNSTAILPTSAPNNAPMNINASPLTYTSMLKVANWLSDLTGQNAHTCTFKTSAWNALSSAEQATIQGILSGKNWNLATA